MAALLAKCVSTNHDHSDRAAKIMETGIVGGMLTDPEGIRRTFPLVDALASISVSKAGRQVIAAAL